MTPALRAEVRAALERLLEQDPLFAPHAELAWDLEEELGRGGMGVVYRVRERALGRVAALKLLQGSEPARVARFLREARVTARLEHPGIPPVYETGSLADGRPWLLMRLVVGQTLAARIAQLHAAGPPAPAALRPLLHALVQVAEAVAYAHGQGVIHRDLKPENLMLGAHGEVFVMDWGLARVPREADLAAGEPAGLAPAAAGLTRDGAVLGTPGFIAPEVLAGGAGVDGRADVFSLGAVLGALLCGVSPFHGASSAEVLARNAGGEAVWPRERVPSTPRPLDAIVRRALARRPEARYPGAAALAQDLRRWLAGEPVSACRYGPRERLRLLADRRPALAVSLVLAAALGLAGGASVVRLGLAGAARERAAEQERARAAALAAADRWERAAEAPRVERTGLALQALDAAGRWHALAGQAESAALGARAAEALASAATAGEEWELALAAADELGDFQPVGQAGLRARVEEARAQAARRRTEEVEALLQRTEREGAPGGLDAGVLQLLRRAGPDTAQRLAAALEGLAGQLEAVEREVWLGAAEPTADEARAGEGPIPGLAAAVEAWRAAAPAAWSPELRQLRERAARRLRTRASVAGREVEAVVLAIVAREQTRRLQPSHWPELARLCCQALGHMGLPERAVPALTRYALAEADDGRAAEAGRALALLEGEGGPAIQRVLPRFGGASAFAAAARGARR